MIAGSYSTKLMLGKGLHNSDIRKSSMLVRVRWR